MAIPSQDQTQITSVFLTFYGRAPTSDELTQWYNWLVNNSYNLAAMQAAIAQDPVAQAYIANWVTAQYLGYLGRDPSASELQLWTNNILGGTNPQQLIVALAAVPGVSTSAAVTTTPAPTTGSWFTDTVFSIGTFNVTGWMLAAGAGLAALMAMEI
jgi:hypothetical protein